MSLVIYPQHFAVHYHHLYQLSPTGKVGWADASPPATLTPRALRAYSRRFPLDFPRHPRRAAGLWYGDQLLMLEPAPGADWRWDFQRDAAALQGALRARQAAWVSPWEGSLPQLAAWCDAQTFPVVCDGEYLYGAPTHPRDPAAQALTDDGRFWRWQGAGVNLFDLTDTHGDLAVGRELWFLGYRPATGPWGVSPALRWGELVGETAGRDGDPPLPWTLPQREVSVGFLLRCSRAVRALYGARALAWIHWRELIAATGTVTPARLPRDQQNALASGIPATTILAWLLGLGSRETRFHPLQRLAHCLRQLGHHGSLVAPMGAHTP